MTGEDAQSPGEGPPPVPQRSPIARCEKCGRPIDRGFAYCPHCGRRRKHGTEWYYSPVWIAIMALFVIGPFALPLVWRSARMNQTMKLIFTASIAVYTAITAYFLWQIIGYEMQALGELDELL